MEHGDLSAPNFDLRNAYSHIVHAAGLAHVVPKTSGEKEQFFKINVEGTRKLLKALENKVPQAFVFISTVAVYGVEVGSEIDETAPRLAVDAYGESKRIAEEEIAEWCSKRGVLCSTLRLPLIVGANAPGNLGAMVTAIKRGRYLRIGSGGARRSMVRAADIAEALPKIAETGGTFNLTDGQHPSFAELDEAICKALNRPSPKVLPLPLARLGGFCGDVFETVTRKRFPLNSRVVTKMTSSLTFSDSKARTAFGWNPKKVLDHPEELV